MHAWTPRWETSCIHETCRSTWLSLFLFHPCCLTHIHTGDVILSVRTKQGELTSKSVSFSHNPESKTDEIFPFVDTLGRDQWRTDKWVWLFFLSCLQRNCAEKEPSWARNWLLGHIDIKMRYRWDISWACTVCVTRWCQFIVRFDSQPYCGLQNQPYCGLQSKRESEVSNMSFE